jgi:hypothetical protein
VQLTNALQSRFFKVGGHSDDKGRVRPAPTAGTL